MWQISFLHTPGRNSLHNLHELLDESIPPSSFECCYFTQSNPWTYSMPAASNRFIQFFVRFRILHILFWTFKYVSLAHQLAENNYKHQPYLDAAFIIIMQCIGVYIIVLYLLPKFIPARKYGRFALSSLILLIVLSYFSTLLKDHYTRWFIDPEFHSRYLTVFIVDFVDALIVSFVFVVLYIAYYYYNEDRKNKLLERQRMEAELIFLRAQINPHFIFNSLNSIYVLMDEDPDIAKDTLLRFSNLLRYQLYDSGYSFTSLENELTFIKDYTELEKVRHGDRIDVKCNIQQVPEYIRIGSLLLIPFVENAFKHIAIDSSAASITISSTYNDGRFQFEVVNSADHPQPVKDKPGGIGLQNVKRRLELLYKEKYSLESCYRDEYYYTTLIINTDEDKLPDRR